MVDEDTISNYFFLQKRIEKTKRRIEYVKIKFQHKNLYTGIQQVDEDIRVKAFNVENETITFVDVIAMAEQHIKELEFKKDHFKRFWGTLQTEEKNYYLSRFKYHEPALNDRLDKEIYEEVAEIEEAVAYRFKKELPAYIQLENISIEEHFEAMAELLGV